MSQKKEKISIVFIIVILGFGLSVIYHYILGAYLGYGFPYNTFLFNPADKFADFTNIVRMAKNLNPYYSGSWPLYFPFGFISAFLLSLIPVKISLVAFFLLFISIFVVYFLHQKPSQIELFKGVTIVLFSYPFLFCFDRANFEMLVFLFVVLFVFYLRKDKMIISSIFLSFAISIKLFPAVFLILFFSKKNYKYLILILVACIVETILSLYMVKGSPISNINDLIFWLGKYRESYIIGNGGLGFGHSIFGIVKTILFVSDKLLNLSYGYIIKTYSSTILNIYMLFCVGSFIFICKLILENELIFWKKIAILVLVMNLFPYVSADYKLIYLFIPLHFFINNKKHDEDDKIFSILFGLLLIPKSWLWMLGAVNIGVIINPVLMVIMLALILKNPLKITYSKICR